MKEGAKFMDKVWGQVTDALKDLEAISQKSLGNPEKPLLVSVRSGAKFSMPGMMDTVLNLFTLIQQVFLLSIC
jgi:pyruvate,orthophosphate dikinase